MDLSKLTRNQQLALGGGAVVLICSFLPWFGRDDASFNAWDTDFLGWSGALLVIAGAIVLTLKVFDMQDLHVAGLAAEQIALLAIGLGAILIVLQFLLGFDIVSYEFPRKFGVYLSVIGGASASYGAFGAMKDAGHEMPTAGDFKSDASE